MASAQGEFLPSSAGTLVASQPTPDPWFAVVLSSFFPGLGHLHTRRPALAVPIILAAAISLASFPILLFWPPGSLRVCLLLLAVFAVLYLADLPLAYLDARPRNRATPPAPHPPGKSPWLAVLLARILPGLGHFYLGRRSAGMGLVAGLILVGLSVGLFGVPELLSDLIISGYVAMAVYLTYLSAPVHATSSKGSIRAVTAGVLLMGVLSPMIKTYGIRPYRMPSEAMMPTLNAGDFFYATSRPPRPIRRGQVVVFEYPPDRSKPYIKRVVAVPGDTVALVDKSLYVNGKQVVEPYVIHVDSTIRSVDFDHRDNLGPIAVGPGKYFVMGDNRDNSNDSRFWGLVSAPLIRGVALKQYWPWSRIRAIH